MLMGGVALAQQKTPAASDSLGAKKYIPTGVRVGTDLLSFARSQYDKTFSGWEFNADVDLDRYYFAVDYGKWARDYTTDTEQYNNSGTYYRVGVDVNFLTKDPEKNMFFIGARYGRARFSEDLSINRTDAIWGNYQARYQNTNINGNWMELTTGLRVRMWKMIWMGYTARFKFGISTNETGDLVPHDIPGYGRTDKDSYWGFNYQIFVRLPVRKQPKVDPTK